VILDEVGRGTSTHDGLAIARAVTEYLHDVVGARTVFATHYHELAIVEEHLSHLAAFQMDVIDRDGEPIFQHRVVPGASSESYGVHVAQMAGLPPSVTQRAAEVLKDSLTIWSRSSRSGGEGGEARLAETPQSYGDVPAPLDNSRAIAVALATLNIAAMTPMEALNLLFSLQQQALTVLRLDEYR
jgi:DNA mismatch repair protein MutS